ncbi:MAG: hypothetical protein KGD60_14340 [Candidatus Thorarchaeota archaeon]|nr:hypothetical protein [Candidatus Thorarchaeota archaeon]
MSFRVLKEAEERAESRMSNIMDATIALVRPRNVRWLGLLAANTDEKTRSIIASESYSLMSYLIRKKELGVTVQAEVRMVYPEFKPEKHFGTITRDEHGRITSFTPVEPSNPLTKDLAFAASVWKTAIRHGEFVDGVIKSLELFADGLWELTGTALVKKMTDFSGKTTYAIDRATADDITAEMFPEEVIEDVKDESKK